MSTDASDAAPMTTPDVTAEAFAGAAPGSAAGVDAPPATGDPGGAGTATEAAVADGVATEPPADASTTTAATTTAPVAAAAAPAVPARRAGVVALVLGRRLLRFAFAVALLGGGVVLGWQAYAGSRPVPTVVGDPAVVGVATPEIVAELANAIEADDSDAIRAALSPQIFSSYAADLQGFGIVRVEKVDTLGTFADGPRSATELVLHGRDAQTSPFSINLVVLTEGGTIVRLR